MTITAIAPTVRATHRISALPLSRLVEAAGPRGHDAEGLLGALGLTEGDRFLFEQRVPEAVALPVLDRLAEADPDLALAAALTPRPQHYSPVWHLARTSETLADVLDILGRYMPLVWSRWRWHTELGPQRAVVVGTPGPERPGVRLLERYVIAEMCRSCPSQLVARPYPIRRICLAGAPLGDGARWAEVADEVVFDAPRLEASCDRSALDLPLRMPDAQLSGFLTHRLDRDLEASAATPATAAALVGDQVRRTLRRAPCRAEIAERLDWSERTLARRLAAEGTTFQQVIDQVRLEAATTWLPQLGVEQVSERLGFSDSRSFQRAFRRWTGTTPSGWLRRA